MGSKITTLDDVEITDVNEMAVGRIYLIDGYRFECTSRYGTKATFQPELRNLHLELPELPNYG